jgi:hypothetical protein
MLPQVMLPRARARFARTAHCSCNLPHCLLVSYPLRLPSTRIRGRLWTWSTNLMSSLQSRRPLPHAPPPYYTFQSTGRAELPSRNWALASKLRVHVVFFPSLRASVSVDLHQSPPSPVPPLYLVMSLPSSSSPNTGAPMAMAFASCHAPMKTGQSTTINYLYSNGHKVTLAIGKATDVDNMLLQWPHSRDG